MPDLLARLLAGMGLFVAACLTWSFIPRFTDWITPGQSPLMIWIGKAIGAEVFAIPGVQVIAGAFG